MKKIILHFLITVLSSFSFNLKAQIPNGDFSNWIIDSIGYLDPSDWVSSNYTYTRPSVLQDVDHVGGSGYSVRLTTAYDSSTSHYRGGNLNIVHHAFSGTIRPSTVNGFWKNYDPFYNNQIIVQVKLYNAANTKIGQCDIGTLLSAGITNWTAFSDTIAYTTSDPVANYSVTLYYFTLSNDSTIYCNIDDLTFDLNTSINENFQNHLSCSLSHLNDIYTMEVDMQVTDKLCIDVIDVNGKTVINSFNGNCLPGIHDFDIDLNNISKGIYFCRIQTGNKMKIFRLVN